MKKILIITKKYKPIYEELVREAKKNKVSATLATPDDFLVSFKNNHLYIKIKQQNLETFDLIYYRSLFRDQELLAIISEASFNYNIKIVDPILGNHQQYVPSKILDYVKLSFAKIPIIDSFYITSKEIHQVDFKFPWIIKTSSGARGEEVYLAKNLDEAKEIFSSHSQKLIVQPYIKNDSDIRVLIVGNKLVGSIKRSSSNKNEYRNNVSLGGRAEEINLSKKDEGLALSATQTLGYSISGVDLIYDSNEKIYKVIEVNRSPQFEGFMKTTKINVPERIINYLIAQIS